MSERNVDVLVIGAGSAGLNAVHQLDRAGANWMLVEADQYGTTCARVGCMPSKLLIAAADAASAVREADTFGIAATPSIDGEAVMRRVRRERDRFVAGMVDETRGLPEERRLCGQARFVGKNRVRVGTDTIVTARSVVIAAGSRPTIPSAFRHVRERLLTSDSIFDLPDLPASLAVIGAGTIGLELGLACARLGVDVTIFDSSDSVGSLSDPPVRSCATRTFRERHKIELGVHVKAIDEHDGGLRVRWETRESEKRSKQFAQVLVATGRASNIDTLDLAAAGISLDNGKPDWDPRTTQIADSPIFLAGDASDHTALLHEAADEGRIAGQNAHLYPDVVAHDRRTPLMIVFTEPQMAIAGSRYSELDLSSVEIGSAGYDDQGRATVIDKACGIVRLYADRASCELLGAEMFGPRMEHMAHLLAWSISQRLSVQTLLKMPFYHPVLEEGLRSALKSLAKAMKIERECRAEDFASSSGV